MTCHVGSIRSHKKPYATRYAWTACWTTLCRFPRPKVSILEASGEIFHLGMHRHRPCLIWFPSHASLVRITSRNLQPKKTATAILQTDYPITARDFPKTGTSSLRDKQPRRTDLTTSPLHFSALYKPSCLLLKFEKRFPGSISRAHRSKLLSVARHGRRLRRRGTHLPRH